MRPRLQRASDAGSAQDPFKGEVPVLTIVPKQERRFSDKVIRLAEHRPPNGEKGLSPGERIAFREIGDRLKKESGVAEQVPSLAARRQRPDAATPEPSGAAIDSNPSRSKAPIRAGRCVAEVVVDAEQPTVEPATQRRSRTAERSDDIAAAADDAMPSRHCRDCACRRPGTGNAIGG